ncbi:2-hydroxyacid dehydrogenase [Mycolicibacterium tokaiense]|uniref:D-isomer specific 2-hydroxyacid dehydrogenase NAD-binding protein n=1 Tax=Mycolicibacterium tokaiense TaxID=39695 RepID=A0A378TC52_9MYCO|nr:2-hydroxyacid dehydrogenase [Mycolicibacterium tokaiense]BBY88055.1 2-hydroxyacid dehydrogenase [Mycolicibacterium tokaiense]STZ57423.1 D-isomer specific 2-hydroxyacid dehydrogenase NAD-binding protein [Mycolicibacterium tokaiense]
MKVLVNDVNLVPHRERFEAGLAPSVEVVWRPGAGARELADDLRDSEVFVGSRFGAEHAAAAEKLALIHVAGAGTDKIDFASLAPGVLVANTFHHEASIAEYVAAMAVLLRRDFLTQDRALRDGRWATSVYDREIPQSPTVRGARVGFVGFGHIGQQAWKLFQAFGSTGVAVTGSGRVDAGEYGLQWAADTTSLDVLMRESDIVVVSAPLTEDTTGMIGGAQLRALGPRGVLINVGRGPLVVEQDLFEALRDGVIAAAAIDVWYSYPGLDGRGAPSTVPFAELPNIVMTPHSSGVTRDTFQGRVDDVVANIVRLDRGEPLRNVVNRP